MGLALIYTIGQTPLEEEEKDALLIPTISSRGELDEFEQQNIENAMAFYWGRRITTKRFFTEAFVKEVHRRMFGDVWKWAGEFRQTDKNIGVDKWTIPTALRTLLDDAQYWVNNDVYSHQEIALRFKHRLVSIHCFPNGNGRHSRLMADLLIYRLFKEPRPFSWGQTSVEPKEQVRKMYLLALKDADKGDYGKLMRFAEM